MGADTGGERYLRAVAGVHTLSRVAKQPERGVGALMAVDRCSLVTGH